MKELEAWVFWVLFEKQSISRKLETQRCPGCLLSLVLFMSLRAIRLQAADCEPNPF